MKRNELAIVEADKGISPAEADAFARDGAVCIRGLIPEMWVERMREAVGRALGREPEMSSLVTRHSVFFQDDAVRDYVMHSPAAEIARQLMRSRSVRYYFDQIFVKEPGTSQPTPWHQDVSYWPVTGRQVCSVWLALDPVTRESSGLEYVAGSHRWREHDVAPLAAWGQEFVDGAAKLGMAELPRNPGLDQIPDIDGHREDYELLNWDMQPGDCLVHQMNTVHGASANTTRTQRRRALAVRFLGDDARYRQPGASADKSLIVPGLKPGDPMDAPNFPLIGSDHPSVREARS